MATAIQSAYFGDTIATAQPDDINSLIAVQWQRANAFLLTLPVNNIVEVSAMLTAAPNKTGVPLHHYGVTVLFLQ